MKVLRMVTLIALMGLAGSVKAIDSKPYIGGDALVQWRQMGFVRDYGHNLFPKISPQLNLYAGLMMSDNLSVEMGYERTNSHTKHVTLLEGDSYLGNILAPLLCPVVFKTKFVIEGPHINTLVFYPITDKTKVFAGAGVAFLMVTFKSTTLRFGNPPISRNRLRTLSQFKPVLRLSAGGIHMLNERIGARLTIGWENTRKICAFPFDGYAPQATIKVKTKNSIIYGVGLFLMI